MSFYYQSGGFLRHPIRVVAIAMACTLGVLVLLPFTQHLAGLKRDGLEVRTIDVSLPPPPPPPPEPPPPEQKQETPPQPKLQNPPKPLSLSQLEMSLNPGVGDAFGGTFGMGAFEVDANALGDLSTFSISELDEVPRLLRQPAWTWPRHAIGKIDSDVKARALIFINPDGRVEVKNFINMSHPVIERDVLEWLQQVRFSQPKRDGKPVRARYIFPLEFAKP